MHFADFLNSEISRKKTALCVGLDPHFDLIFDEFKKKFDDDPEKILENFCVEIVDAVADFAAAVKPNFAFFEKFGWRGIRVFEKICAFAKSKNLPVIVDAKRNDIGSTAAASAEYFLQNKIFDALTINPFLGADSIAPFLKLANKNEKGIFILVKTSNAGSRDFQDEICGEKKMHEKLAEKVAKWGAENLNSQNFSNCGAVVGATFPDEIRNLRKKMPAQIFLIPGFGAQGGDLKNTFGAFRDGGFGAVVNSSRGISFAEKNWNFAAAARAECEKIRENFAEIF